LTVACENWINFNLQQQKTGWCWWFGTFLIHSVGNVIIPTDELHHFSEGLKPPTKEIFCRSFQ
jgi:hypothetical protein